MCIEPGRPNSPSERPRSQLAFSSSPPERGGKSLHSVLRPISKGDLDHVHRISRRRVVSVQCCFLAD
jgi:hypothetical protein